MCAYGLEMPRATPDACLPWPLGMQDPLGLSADGDVDKFNRYRAIEIKHGRGK